MEIDEHLIRGDKLTAVSAWEFCAPDRTVILRIDQRGMTYKGQRIEDTGEAYKAFLDAMAAVNVYYARG